MQTGWLESAPRLRGSVLPGLRSPFAHRARIHCEHSAACHSHYVASRCGVEMHSKTEPQEIPTEVSVYEPPTKRKASNCHRRFLKVKRSPCFAEERKKIAHGE